MRSPLDPENASQIAPDEHAALVEFEIRGDADDAADKIGPVLDRVDVAQQVHPEFFIGEFGDASAVDAVETAYADDLEKAGQLSLPITLIILVIAFGALVAAGIPLLLALTAVFATFGLVALSSHFLPMAMQAPAVVLLIGLAVGVDYSMFYLRREREERAAGRSQRAAVEAAAATSGRSVLVSGLIVMTAMAGMFLTGDQIFASIAIATIAVVAIAVLGSLTVLPALLCRLGDNVDRLRVPLVRRLRRDDGQGRFWGAIVDRVMRRPVCRRCSPAGCWLPLRSPRSSFSMASPSPDTYPELAPRGPDLHPHAGGLSRHGPSGQRRRQGARRECTRRAGGDSGARRACARERPHARADHGGRQSGRDGREHHGAHGGKRRGRGL